MFLAKFLIGLLITGLATIGFVSNFEWADMLPIVIFFSDDILPFVSPDHAGVRDQVFQCSTCIMLSN